MTRPRKIRLATNAPTKTMAGAGLFCSTDSWRTASSDSKPSRGMGMRRETDEVTGHAAPHTPHPPPRTNHPPRRQGGGPAETVLAHGTFLLANDLDVFPDDRPTD